MLKAFINQFDNAAYALMHSLGRTYASLTPVAGLYDANTFVCDDNSMLTYVAVKGALRVIAEDELKKIEQAMVQFINQELSADGITLDVALMKQAVSQEKLTKQKQSMLEAAKSLGLDIDVIGALAASEQVLMADASEQVLIFAIKTPARVAPKQSQRKFIDEDVKARTRAASAFNNPRVPQVGKIFAAINNKLNQKIVTTTLPQVAIHQSVVASFESALIGLGFGLSVDVYSCVDAIKALRVHINPDDTAENWQPPLELNKNHANADSKNPGLETDVLAKPLCEMILDKVPCEDGSIVQYGDDYFGAVNLSIAQKNITSVEVLLRAAESIGIKDVTYSLSIKGGNQRLRSTINSRKLTALRLCNLGVDQNQQIADDCAYLLEFADLKKESLATINLSLFARAKTRSQMQELMNKMTVLMQSWGGANVETDFIAPLQNAIETIPGFNQGRSRADLIMPASFIAKYIPIRGAVSPWQTGVVFKSLDNAIYPIRFGSSLQSSWLTLICAPPGAGKSVMMQQINLHNALSGGQNELPIIRIVDIGPSSKGFIDLLQAALPNNRKREAEFMNIINSESCAINPFDTALGFRKPENSTRAFIINLLSLILTDGTEYDSSVNDVIAVLVDETYAYFAHKKTAKVYVEGMDKDLDESIARLDVQADSFWDLVDKLALKGEYKLAASAQRYAMPLIKDLSKVLSESTTIQSTMATKPGIIEHIQAKLASAVSRYPILCKPTAFSAVESKVISLNLEAVIQGGADDNPLVKQNNALMYLLARRALMSDLTLTTDEVRAIDEPFKSFHEKQQNQHKLNTKTICFDELHRTTGSPQVRAQIDEDIREVRKQNVALMLSSQRYDDFSAVATEFSTTQLFMGVPQDEELPKFKRRFSLSTSDINIAKNHLSIDKSSGARVFVKARTKKGDLTQALFLKLSAISLWSFSSTSEDAQLRMLLTKRLPYIDAIKALAKKFPSGSAKSFIENQVDETQDVTTIVQQLVEDMARER